MSQFFYSAHSGYSNFFCKLYKTLYSLFSSEKCRKEMNFHENTSSEAKIPQWSSRYSAKHNFMSTKMDVLGYVVLAVNVQSVIDYGRVQSVKLLPRSLKDDDGSTGLCATVAFMDIKSAAKAHNMEHKLDERSTEYYEPHPAPSPAPPLPLRARRAARAAAPAARAPRRSRTSLPRASPTGK
ncbi:uncharacterized protein GBIM_04747 [Gryllus bimaculatus]|nr:uncharacterized protein GBIM_04747 [Gryllus bimaculatus]